MTSRRWLGAILTATLALGAAFPAAAVEKKKPKKKAEYDYEKSKYKSYKVLVDEPRTYRFDENGDPIPPPQPRKKGAKKKGGADRPKVQAPPASEPAAAPEPAPSCEESDTCEPKGKSSQAPG